MKHLLRIYPQHMHYLPLLLAVVVFTMIQIYQSRIRADTVTTYNILSAPYSAKCDGTSDDAPAIQSAIRAAEANGGGIVLFPDNRTCTVQQNLTILKPNVRLQGSGDGRDASQSPEYRNEGVSAIDYGSGGNKIGQSRVLMNTAIPNDPAHPYYREMPVDHPLKTFQKIDTAFSISLGVAGTVVKDIRFVGPRIWYKAGNGQPEHRGKVLGGQHIRIENVVFDGVGYAYEQVGPIDNGRAIDLTVHNAVCINWGRQCFGANKDTRVTNSIFRQTGVQWDGTIATYVDSAGRVLPKRATERWAEYAVYSYSCPPTTGSVCAKATLDPEKTLVDYNFTFENNYVEGLYIGVQAYGSSGRRSGYTFKNNQFKGNRDALLGSNLLEGARWQDVLIEGNEFIDSLRYDIYIYNGQNFTIRNNVFRQTGAATGGEGATLKTLSQRRTLDIENLIFANNRIDTGQRRNWSAMEFFESGGYLTSTTTPPKPFYFADIKISNITVHHNDIRNLGDIKYGSGISFMRADDGMMANFSFRCNKMHFGPAAGTSTVAALRVGGENSSSIATLRNVTFEDNDIAVDPQATLANIYGIYSDKTSKVSGGSVARNRFTGFLSNNVTQFANQGMSITGGEPQGCSTVGPLISTIGPQPSGSVPSSDPVASPSVVASLQASPSPSPSPNQSAPVSYYLEAEDAVVSPLSAIKADQPGASKGKYVSFATTDLTASTSPHTAPNTVKFTLSITKSGHYTVWARFLAKDAASNGGTNESNKDSFWVSIVKGTNVQYPEDVFDMTEPGRTWGPDWQWAVLKGRGGTNQPATVNPLRFVLNQGNYSLIFRTREAGARLDKIFITESATIIPSDQPDITLHKTVTPAFLRSGQAASIHLVVTNTSTTSFTNVRVSDTVPNQFLCTTLYRDEVEDATMTTQSASWNIPQLNGTATVRLRISCTVR